MFSAWFQLESWFWSTHYLTSPADFFVNTSSESVCFLSWWTHHLNQPDFWSNVSIWINLVFNTMSTQWVASRWSCNKTSKMQTVKLQNVGETRCRCNKKSNDKMSNDTKIKPKIKGCGQKRDYKNFSPHYLNAWLYDDKGLRQQVWHLDSCWKLLFCNIPRWYISYKRQF